MSGRPKASVSAVSAGLPPGRPYPLGAKLRDGGVNFAVFAGEAEAVDLCVFDAAGHESRHPLTHSNDGVWHGFLAGAGAGLVYGYRAHGRYAPDEGQRHNPHKLLLDPYAQEIVGRFNWRDEHYGYQRGHPDGHLSFDRRDNAPWMLKARVAAPLPPLADRPPHTPLAESVLYELHVKGFTKLHPELPEALRGTYAGLGHPAVIDHLTRLGVTAVSLLPVHYAIDEARLAELGLVNYWGYNTLGFFAPDRRLSATPDDPTATRLEFRAMVQALHAAGIEVLLDVVYNHSAEAGEDGPTLSLRGLDNAACYRLAAEDRSRYDNFTGCGNTLKLAHPRMLQLVLDSLRHWVSEYGIDGFRFDLAPVLGRVERDFEAGSALLTALLQDPVLARCKLIAEPWDVGPHGYQLGRFPGRFAEWNDRFRDSTRLFWNSRGVGRGEFARRLLASNDRFHHGRRRPSASINFVCAHDGFTLHDLVSYGHKHNQANGEHNRDGHHANFSTNCGVEGPTIDRAVLAQRARLMRALLASTLLAQGTPMLLAGDELGHGQRGNNNAYCQDNATSWIAWSDADVALIDYTGRLIRLRREHRALRQDHWLADGSGPDGERDARWLAPDAAHWRDMTVDDWHDDHRHALGLWLSPPNEAAVLLWINAESAPLRCALPPGRWMLQIDSSRGCTEVQPLDTTVDVPAQAILVLIRYDAA